MSVCKSVSSPSLGQQAQTVSKQKHNKDLPLKGLVKVIGKVAYSLSLSPVSAEWSNYKKGDGGIGEGARGRGPPGCWGGGGGGGDPPPPSLDRPWGIARIGVYKSREAPGRHS